jgi:hypothetical protein
VVENEAIYLFLHATLGGLVEMDWLIYCAVLRLSLQTSGAWELMRTSMRGSGRIRPGETALFALEAEPGLLIGGIMESDAFFVFELSGERLAAPQTISIVIGPAPGTRTREASRRDRSSSPSAPRRNAKRSSASCSPRPER